MINALKQLKNERIVSVKEVQKSPSQALRGITRILRGSKTLGFFLDTATFHEFIEDLEAAGSAPYRKRIKQSRSERGSNLSIKQVNDRYGL